MENQILLEAKKIFVHEMRNYYDRLETPHEILTFNTVRDYIETVDRCILVLNAKAGFPDEVSSLIRCRVLEDASWPFFAMAINLSTITPKRISDQLIQTWCHATETLSASSRKKGFKATIRKLLPDLGIVIAPKKQARLMEHVSSCNESLAMYHLALSTLLSGAESSSEARQEIRRIMSTMDLSFDDVGRMFGTSGETVRRWESRQVGIATDRMEALSMTKAALTRLLKLFRPHRLAQVIRRKAEFFEGERALDWILRGRIVEVAGRYEMALTYQA